MFVIIRDILQFIAGLVLIAGCVRCTFALRDINGLLDVRHEKRQ